MRKTKLSITLFVVSLLLPAAAGAQIRAGASIELNLPVVLPQLVVVAPGVQVVPEVDHEIFFVDGVYWARHGDGWYRSHSHRGGWVYVQPRRVPGRIATFRPGKYKRWKPAKHDRGVRDHGRGEGRVAKRDDRGRGGHDSRGRDDGRGKHGKHGKH
jgi:hypothetical protein